LPTADPSPVAVRTSGGCLGAFFFVGIGIGCVALIGGLIVEMTHLVPAKQIGLLFGVHIMLVPLAIFLGVLLPKVNATIDTALGEVVLVHRLLGVTYARTIAPLEIVESFFAERGKGRSLSYLGIDVAQPQHGRRRREMKPEDHIKLVDGDRVEQAAIALNLALGFNQRASNP